MTNATNDTRRFASWIIAIQIGAAAIYAVGIFATNAYSPEKLRPYEREFILKMEFPFNISTELIYTVVQTVQTYYLFIVAYGITVVNSLLITLCITTPDARAILVKSVLFFISMNVEAFIYCFCGEHLSAKSKMIGNAAYNSRWYDFSTKESRIILFLILRSQKRLTITSGKVVDLSLERFTGIGSAAIYAVGVFATNAFSPKKLEPYAREFILKMEFPFNISTELIYTVVQTVQLYHLFVVAYGITVVNSLLVTLCISTPDATAILVKSVLFFISMNIEAFIYCFCGEHLSAKSKMIGNAAYNSRWYDFPTKESRIILFLILRSQKRLTITSGKVVDLSLERFTSCTFRRIFFDVLQMMSEDWQVHTSNPYNSRIMTNVANVARRTSRWIVGMQIGSATFYSVGVLAANANSPEKLEPYARELILKMEFPFNISTDFIYATVQTVQFYHLFLVACGITIINSLLVTLILHICGQIDILREWLTNIFSKNSTNSLDEITMQSLIIKHQRIIIFAESIETLYTYIALMMLLSDTIIICCLGFIIATSKMIGSAAYDSLWYDFSIKESRTLLFLILRSQKRLTITSGKIVDLSLERFTSVRFYL
ncbi:PREDICTED: uncharacterized protein LOC108778726 [Cyphomyrmex costatus]|uniref:uncharacterized protein LOC108778726 n=1 Tax=Cyphomyrmex costatus TaxID=456900 RepID=UPI0008523885|nr:PREDICTED: uncharacterized protein LOC108778726 [Cyphomyrmex costatus]